MAIRESPLRLMKRWPGGGSRNGALCQLSREVCGRPNVVKASGKDSRVVDDHDFVMHQPGYRVHQDWYAGRGKSFITMVIVKLASIHDSALYLSGTTG